MHACSASQEVEKLLQSLLLISPEIMRKRLPEIYDTVSEEVIETSKDILHAYAGGSCAYAFLSIGTRLSPSSF